MILRRWLGARCRIKEGHQKILVIKKMLVRSHGLALTARLKMGL